jgi:hypothetical protein
MSTQIFKTLIRNYPDQGLFFVANGNIVREFRLKRLRRCCIAELIFYNIMLFLRTLNIS